MNSQYAVLHRWKTNASKHQNTKLNVYTILVYSYTFINSFYLFSYFVINIFNKYILLQLCLEKSR